MMLLFDASCLVGSGRRLCWGREGWRLMEEEREFTQMNADQGADERRF
jgi:hypothetical protein